MARCRVVLPVALALVGAWALGSTSQAATFTVDRTDDQPAASGCDPAISNDCSLRGAVLAANAGADADTIELPAGTYTLTVDGAGESTGAADDLDVKNTLTIAGAGSASTIVQACTVSQETAACPAGQGIAHRVFHPVPDSGSITVEIRGVTIRHGRAAADQGGAIYNPAGTSTLRLNDVVVRDNLAATGGGISSGGPLFVVDGAVTGNTATAFGGGIQAMAATLESSLVGGNHAAGGGGAILVGIAIGGGTLFGGTLVATDSSLDGNTTDGGGGGILTNGDVTLNGVTVSGNTAATSGGGVNAGGIFIATNSTFSGNTVSSECGGLFLRANGTGTPHELSSVTITDNTNTTGHGGGVCNSGNIVNVRNSIIAGNHAPVPTHEPDCTGPFISKGHNLVGLVRGAAAGSGFCSGFQNGTNGDQVGSAASPIDADLEALADNGGPTETHGLGESSPAIDAGNPAGCEDHTGAVLVFDQRGEPRIADGDDDGVGRCDIGALEGHGGVSASGFAIRPTRAVDEGVTAVIFYGLGLVEGTTVKLTREGEADILPESTEVRTEGSVLGALFDVDGRALGLWNAVVTRPGESEAILPDAFSIEDATHVELWADFLGPGIIRPGLPARFSFLYGNRGIGTAYAVPIVIGIPRDFTFDAITVAPPPDQSGQAAIDWDRVPIVMGSPDVPGTQVISLLLPYVPAGFTGTLTVTLFAPASALGRDVELPVGIGDPLVVRSQVNAEAVTRFVEGARAYARRVLGVGLSDEIVPQMEAYVRSQLLQIGTPTLQTLLGGVPIPFAVPHLTIGLAAGFLDGGEECLDGIDNDGDGLVDLADPECDRRIGRPLEDDDEDGDGEEDPGFEFPGDEDDPPECEPEEAENPWYGDDNCNGEPDCKEGGFDTCAPEPCKKWPPTACGPKPPPKRPVRNSHDPNDKRGSVGAGEGHFISGAEPLRYTVLFENLPAAALAAQTVEITDALDPTTMDLSTLSLGRIGFGDREVFPPPGLSSFATEIDLRPEQDLIVGVEASLDVSTGVLTWRFRSLDPETGEPTTDPLAGFLPPNQSPPDGEGSVLFAVDPKGGLASGTEIRNQATIVFDTNEPIVTPEWINTIDVEDPTSQVDSAVAPACSPSIAVTWSGSDAGSGVASFDVLVSEDGGPFVPWRNDTVLSGGTYVGDWGKTYGFASVARDETGNVEEAPTAPDATAAVADCGPFDLAVTKIAASKVAVQTEKKPAPTKFIKIQIQNRSAVTQTIPSLGVLRDLVTLEVEPLGAPCAAPTPVLVAGKPQKKRPIVLGPKKKLNVVYEVTFGCAVDPAQSSARDPGHEDFALRAAIEQSVLGGTDAFPLDDACPRTVTPPGVVVPYPDGKIVDQGCGKKQPDKTFGAPVLVDVVDKR